MTKLLKLSFKNIFRNKKRSILTFLAVTVGISAFIFTTAFIDGNRITTIKSYIKTTVSPIKIYNSNYFENRNELALENLIINADDLEKVISEVDKSLEYAKRLRFKARLIINTYDIICKVVGIETGKDEKIFKIKDSIKQEENKSFNEIYNNFVKEPNVCLIGENLADSIGVKTGDEIILYTRTKNNAHNAISYKVLGLLNTENTEMDSFSLVMKLDDAIILGDTENDISEIVINILEKDKNILDSIKEKINKKILNTFSLINYRAYSWEEQLTDIIESFKIHKGRQRIVIILLLILGITCITNTMLMAVFERTKEIGTFSAFGMKKKEIIWLFLFEGMYLGLFGGITAILITSIPVYILSNFGLNFSNSSLDQNTITKIYGSLDMIYYPLSLIIAILTAGLATLYPSIKAVNLNIAQILRTK